MGTDDRGKREGQEQARLEESGVLAKWRPLLETGTLGAVMGGRAAGGEGPMAGPGTPCVLAVLHSKISCEHHHIHPKDWPATAVTPATGREYLLWDLAGRPASAGLSPPAPTHLLARLG